MGLMDRVRKLEQQSKELVIHAIEFCGYKINTKNIVDDWVQAVIETSEADEKH